MEVYITITILFCVYREPGEPEGGLRGCYRTPTLEPDLDNASGGSVHIDLNPREAAAGCRGFFCYPLTCGGC